MERVGLIPSISPPVAWVLPCNPLALLAPYPQNLASRRRETQNFASRRDETPLFEARPKLPQTSRPRNIFGHFGSNNDLKMTKFDQADMSNFWGLLFFWKKTAGGHLGWEPRVLCTIQPWLGLLAWPWLAWPSSPRTGLARLACTRQQRRRPPLAAGAALRAAVVVAGAGKSSKAGTRRG